MKALTVTTPRPVAFWGTRQVVEPRRRTPAQEDRHRGSGHLRGGVPPRHEPARRTDPPPRPRRPRPRALDVEAVHHRRDRTRDEDRHTAPTGHALLAWAIARDTAISAPGLTGHTRIAKALRATARQPERALQIIGLISEKGL